MNENKKPSRLKVILKDFLFSLGINFFYIIASGLSSAGHKIGGSGDGGMIWILFFFLWTMQFILVFFTLTLIEIFAKEKTRNKKTFFYALTNSFILICVLINIKKPVFEGNNTILLFNFIVFIGFILYYNHKNEKNRHGKLDFSERIEKKTLNDRIRNIFPNTSL